MLILKKMINISEIYKEIGKINCLIRSKSSLFRRDGKQQSERIKRKKEWGHNSYPSFLIKKHRRAPKNIIAYLNDGARQRLIHIRRSAHPKVVYFYLSSKVAKMLSSLCM